MPLGGMKIRVLSLIIYQYCFRIMIISMRSSCLKMDIAWLLGSSHVLFLVIQMWAFLDSSLSCVLTYPFLYVCYILICGEEKQHSPPQPKPWKSSPLTQPLSTFCLNSQEPESHDSKFM